MTNPNDDAMMREKIARSLDVASIYREAREAMLADATCPLDHDGHLVRIAAERAIAAFAEHSPRAESDDEREALRAADLYVEKRDWNGAYHAMVLAHRASKAIHLPEPSAAVAGDFVMVRRDAAQQLLDDLNARIEAAWDDPSDRLVPVFPGIVELHNALTASPTVPIDQGEREKIADGVIEAIKDYDPSLYGQESWETTLANIKPLVVRALSGVRGDGGVANNAL